MLKIISLKRLAIIITIVGLLFLSFITLVSFGAGILAFAIFHVILSLSFFNTAIAEFFLGNKLSEEQKTNLRRVGSSPIFAVLLAIINSTYIGLAIYALFALGGFRLINAIK
ncbi:MAG: hypothetical protein ABSD79_00025 [Dehalococcoidales bacterium]|jgi:diacylglycerol kinase